MTTNLSTSRRNFLKSSAALTIGFCIGGSVQNSEAKTLSLDEVDSFIAIGKDGQVTLYTGKVELGQGIRTAMMQITAEELDVPFSAVTVVEGDTLLTPAQGLTGGSVSIQIAGQAIRRAAATARSALVTAAAARFGVPFSTVTVRDGVCVAGSNSVSFGALVPQNGFELKLDSKVSMKAASTYQIVGKPIRRIDVRPKVRGEYLFAHDVVRPGMIHARVIRPSAVGASLERFDDTQAKKTPGYLGVVRDKDFLAVTSRTEWGAIRAARVLQASWTGGGRLPAGQTVEQIVKAIKVAKDDVTANKGDAGTELTRQGTSVLKSSYSWPMQTHGSIGPSCAVAEISEGKLTCWTASQATHDLQKQISAMLNMTDSAVRLIYVEGAGCYGRNGHEDCTSDAALIAKHTGKPVRVQWMRHEEHGWDPKGPPTFHEYEGAVGTDRKIVAWRSGTWVPNHEVGTVPLTASLASGRKDGGGQGVGLMRNNSEPPYEIPNLNTTVHQMASTPLRASWIRTPGRMQNCFAVESFMDELAIQAKSDPVAFRLAHLSDSRARYVIEQAAKQFGWVSRSSFAQGLDGNRPRGQGAAFLRYNNNGTYVAAFAEVTVDRQTGLVRVERFTVAHDCGLVINPDGIRQNVEGNVLQTCSRVLKESLGFDSNGVTSLDWASYPISRFSEMPSVDVLVIDRPDQPSTGAGEPSAAAIPGAIANAIFDATGARMRHIPFTPERVLAELKTVRAAL